MRIQFFHKSVENDRVHYWEGPYSEPFRGGVYVQGTTLQGKDGRGDSTVVATLVDGVWVEASPHPQNPPREVRWTGFRLDEDRVFGD